jgi:protein TonB
VTLELSPVSEAPAPPPEEAQAAQPDSQAAQPDSQPAPPSAPVAQAAPPPQPTPDPIPSPPPPAVAPEAVSPPPPPQPTATPEIVSAPPPPDPAPPTPAPTVVDLPPQPPSPPPAAPSAAATAEKTAAPRVSPGREETTISPAALRSWQRELIAQIERHKRFPAGAKGRSGVVRVAFGIDRAGRLSSVRILSSSGSAELDRAALDLIRQSQPFPAPPAALGESDLNFVAPVRYLRGAAR